MPRPPSPISISQTIRPRPPPRSKCPWHRCSADLTSPTATSKPRSRLNRASPTSSKPRPTSPIPGCGSGRTHCRPAARSSLLTLSRRATRNGFIARCGSCRNHLSTGHCPASFCFNAPNWSSSLPFCTVVPVKTIGLTGGVGMGKSACAQLLQWRGAAVVDTDELARKVVEPGQPALAEVREVFGNDIVGPDGQLKRESLAQIVFGDATARRKLEDILHPRIRELWRAQLEAWRNAGKRLAVVVIPLLFETKAESEFDAVICVACSAATQRQRLLARGWTPEQIAQRITAQMPVEGKMLRANYVLWTEAGMDVHAQQIYRIVPLAR